MKNLLNFRLFCGLIAALTLMGLAPEMSAQNNTNSPYSRFGYGDLAMEGADNTRAMGGVAYGLRDKKSINYLNPASYTAIDSLTFNFEGSYSVHNTNFVEGGVKKNARNSSFNMLAMHFRFGKWAAMSLGMVPYSNVGYNIYKGGEDEIDSDFNTIVTTSGEGGIHKVYGGLGLKPLKDLSVGVNVSYLWGNLQYDVTQNYLNSDDAMIFDRLSNIKIRGIMFDFGLQYTRQIARNQSVTLGLVFQPGKNLSNKYNIDETLGNETLGYTESIRDSVMTTSVPTKFGIGLAYTYSDRLTVAADYTVEKWSKATVLGVKGSMKDRKRLSLGAEYQPDSYGNYLQRIKYRLGAYVETPYYLKDGKCPYRSYGVTAGLCLPLGNTNSIMHITGQYVRDAATSSKFVSQNVLRLTIGVTFSERWFFKRLVY